MKLNLVLIALLQQALCAPLEMDPAELESALQARHLDAWVESIAAKRQIPKHAVRSSIQAVTYHLDPASEDSGDAGGEHAKLERRQAPVREYPETYLHEAANDDLTDRRLSDYHGRCRRGNGQPPKSRFTPSNAFSFWRAIGGTCAGNTVQLSCGLPTEFGPPGWRTGAPGNVHTLPVPCASNQQCMTFMAHNYLQKDPVTFSGCISVRGMDKTGSGNDYAGKYMCPIGRGSSTLWDIYAESVDGKEITWTVFSGAVDDHKIVTSRSSTFMFMRQVEWGASAADGQPWMTFARAGRAAPIRLYTRVGSA